MLTLSIIVLIAVGVSFLCSVFEAVLLCVTPSYIATLAQTDPAAASRLSQQKDNIEAPLVAILTLNTVAHTVGAAVAGAQAARVLGDELLGVFSALLTFIILFFSEIIPKTLGANHWRRLAPLVTFALVWLQRITWPLIWMSRQVTHLLGKGDEGQYIRQEMSAMARLGHESGELDAQESKILTQMLKIRDMPVTAIMTPRTVMFSLPVSLSLAQFASLYANKPFSRIPVYDKDHDDIIGYVNRTEILLAAHDTPDKPLSTLKHSLLVVPESAKILPLFERMNMRHTQIAMVVDEYGSGQGIVTQEDILESMLGLEIVDSNDPVADMQQLARKLWKRRMQEKGIRLSEDGDFESTRDDTQAK